MTKENVSLDFRLKKLMKQKIIFLEKIKQNVLMSENHKEVCRCLNYFEHFLISISAVTVCVSISAFASLVGALANVTSSAIEIKIFLKSLLESRKKEKSKN